MWLKRRRAVSAFRNVQGPSLKRYGAYRLEEPAPIAAAPSDSSVMRGRGSRDLLSGTTSSGALLAAGCTIAICDSVRTRKQAIDESETMPGGPHHIPLFHERGLAVLSSQVRHIRLVNQVSVHSRLVPVGSEPVSFDLHFKTGLGARVACQLAHICSGYISPHTL